MKPNTVISDKSFLPCMKYYVEVRIITGCNMYLGIARRDSLYQQLLKNKKITKCQDVWVYSTIDGKIYSQGRQCKEYGFRLRKGDLVTLLIDLV